MSENNRRAKYDRLTRAGRKRVEKETRDWQQTAPSGDGKTAIEYRFEDRLESAAVGVRY